MEIRQLEYFTAVADTGGFGRAAASLHIVQAAVSQQIRRLERELGVRLFDRSTRHVRLTDAGRRLLPEARAVLAAVERTRRLAADLAAGDSGVLRLGIGRAYDAGTYRVVAAATSAGSGPRVETHRTTLDERLSGVRDGTLDAAVVRVQDSAPGLEFTPLWTDPLYVAAPTDVIPPARDSVRLTDLSALPLRMAPRQNNPAFHDLILDACRRCGFDPVPGPAFTTLLETLHDIAGGAPSWTVFYPLDKPPTVPGVTLHRLSDVTTDVNLVTRPGPATPAIRHLLAAVRETTG